MKNQLFYICLILAVPLACKNIQQDNAVQLDNKTVYTVENDSDDKNSEINISSNGRSFDSIRIQYPNSKYLVVYIYARYDTIENNPIKSMAVINELGDTLFNSIYSTYDYILPVPFEEDEELVAFPLYSIVNQQPLKIQVHLYFYSNSSSFYDNYFFLTDNSSRDENFLYEISFAPQKKSWTSSKTFNTAGIECSVKFDSLVSELHKIEPFFEQPTDDIIEKTGIIYYNTLQCYMNNPDSVLFNEILSSKIDFRKNSSDYIVFYDPMFIKYIYRLLNQ